MGRSGGNGSRFGGRLQIITPATPPRDASTRTRAAGRKRLEGDRVQDARVPRRAEP